LSRRLTRSYFIVTIALMSSLSIIFDLLPSVRVPWGMKIDFVGTIWVLSYFLYGLSVSIPVSAITFLYISIFSETGFVGASMKFIATIPMFLVPALISYLPFFGNRNSKIHNNIIVILGLCILSNIVRLLLTITVNYYWAIPLWFGIPTERILETLFNNSFIAFVIFVAGMNILQGIIDILLPWLLAYKLKLSTMFGTW